MSEQNVARYVPAETGPAFWGPGDRYTFLVTGAQSDGAYFIMEALVPPGDGPPPHIHRREQESFYLLDGTLSIQMGDTTVQASTGDFVHIPCGMVHSFSNTGTARMLLIFSPGGIERFFEETLEPATDRFAEVPDNMEHVVARYVEAAPRATVRLRSAQQAHSAVVGALLRRPFYACVADRQGSKQVKLGY